MPTLRRPAILTGAGSDREPEIDTVRDLGDAWPLTWIEDVATPDAFQRDHGRVHAFYNARRARLTTIVPDAAHRASARLERLFLGKMQFVIRTVDDLHERVWSHRLLHMQGTLNRLRCVTGDGVHDCFGTAEPETPCPGCRRPTMRPDAVWFGKIPMRMALIERTLTACDRLVSIGTLGTVRSADGFAEIAKAHARTSELTVVPSSSRWNRFDDGRLGSPTQLVPAFFAKLLGA